MLLCWNQSSNIATFHCDNISMQAKWEAPYFVKIVPPLDTNEAIPILYGRARAWEKGGGNFDVD